MFLDSMRPFLQEAWEKSHFEAATPIQRKVIPLIMEGRDVLAESPTGTGKTIAYVLPLLNKISAEQKSVQAVIIAPTRELVMQIYRVIQQWIKGSDLKVASFIGGVSMKRQTEMLKLSPTIVVGTPGRLLELIKMRKLKMHEVKTIVLDEGDQLLIPERIKPIKAIVKATMRDRQLLVFSATLPEKVIQIGQSIMDQPMLVSVNKNNELPNNVEHIYFLCEQRDKIDLLRRLVRGQMRSALTFVKDIGNLNVLAEKLTYHGIELRILHGESKKQAREANLKKFHEEKYPLLLATDLAARGLDITDLSHVVHYDFPENRDQYIHRSGRTGRMGAHGTVVSLVTKREEKTLKKFSRELRIPIQKKELYSGKIMDERPKRQRNKSKR